LSSQIRHAFGKTFRSIFSGKRTAFAMHVYINGLLSKLEDLYVITELQRSEIEVIIVD